MHESRYNEEIKIKIYSIDIYFSMFFLSMEEIIVIFE